MLGKVLEATDEIEIINRNRFLEANSDLAQKIYDVYKEVFNKELELERLNFVLVERIW